MNHRSNFASEVYPLPDDKWAAAVFDIRTKSATWRSRLPIHSAESAQRVAYIVITQLSESDDVQVKGAQA